MVLAKTKDDKIALSHQGRALKFLISACQDTASASTDINIMTAVFLAWNESALGKVDAAEQCLRGLTYLIHTRGGLHNLGMGGALASHVKCLDHYVAMWRNQPPTYHLTLPAAPLQSCSNKPKLGRAFRDLLSRPSALFDSKLVQAAVDCSQLIEIYEKGARGLATASELTYFDYLQPVVEYQLILVNSRFSGTRTENESVCLATLLCSILVCRNYGSVIPLYHLLSSRLWVSIRLRQVYSSTACDDLRIKLDIWLVFMSLAVGLDADCPHAVEALYILQVLVRKLPVQSWEELRDSVLDVYVWSEVAQGNLFQKIWREMQEVSNLEV